MLKERVEHKAAKKFLIVPLPRLCEISLPTTDELSRNPGNPLISLRPFQEAAVAKEGCLYMFYLDPAVLVFSRTQQCSPSSSYSRAALSWPFIKNSGDEFAEWQVRNFSRARCYLAEVT